MHTALVILYACYAMLCEWNCRKNVEESLNKGQVKKHIPSIVSALKLRPTLQRPNTPQKHASKLPVMTHEKILGQRPSVGTHCTMLNSQTSHAQRLKWQICSVWSSILMSESLPLVTLV